MLSDYMLHVPNFAAIGPGIQMILVLLPQQSERLKGCMKNAAEMDSGALVYTSYFINSTFRSS
jgi:hypothetical protein